MRPIWKGAISFGLIFVPVKLYAATEQRDIRFNFLHQKCKSPVQNKRFCPVCQEEVTMEEIVRGYEYEKGKYVVISEDELEALSGPDMGKNIEILDFVNLEEIDPLFYEKGYYLAPQDGGAKVYELLKRSIGETNRVAVARVTMRSKVTLAAIRVNKETLVMSTMHYPDEIRQPSLLPELNYQVNLHDNEVKMAVSLINSLSTSFQPEKYTDTRREGLTELIQAKVAGEAVEIPARQETGKVLDLMEALKASIDMANKDREQPGAKEDVKAPARKKTAGARGAPDAPRRKTS